MNTSTYEVIDPSHDDLIAFKEMRAVVERLDAHIYNVTVDDEETVDDLCDYLETRGLSYRLI
jgi:hypothetical protein